MFIFFNISIHLHNQHLLYQKMITCVLFLCSTASAWHSWSHSCSHKKTCHGCARGSTESSVTEDYLIVQTKTKPHKRPRDLCLDDEQSRLDWSSWRDLRKSKGLVRQSLRFLSKRSYWLRNLKSLPESVGLTLPLFLTSAVQICLFPNLLNPFEFIGGCCDNISFSSWRCWKNLTKTNLLAN